MKRIQNVGYRRVSSRDQNFDRQLTWVELDRVFDEKASARTADRPQLKACLGYVRAGDTLHVHSIDRLARNLTDLTAIVDNLTALGVTVRFHKEAMTFDGREENPMNRLMLQMLGAVAEFERNLINERRREGQDAATTKQIRASEKLLVLNSPRISEREGKRLATLAAVERLTALAGLGFFKVIPYRRITKKQAAGVWGWIEANWDKLKADELLPARWLQKRPKRVGLGVIQTLLKHVGIDCKADQGKDGITALTLDPKDHHKHAAKVEGGSLPVYLDDVERAIDLVRLGATVKDACKKAGCSRDRYYKRISRVEGGSLPVYLDAIEHAIDLVRLGATVKDACEKAGCSERTYYARTSKNMGKR